jgi:hypothetical protein
VTYRVTVEQKSQSIADLRLCMELLADFHKTSRLSSITQLRPLGRIVTGSTASLGSPWRTSIGLKPARYLKNSCKHSTRYSDSLGTFTKAAHAQNELRLKI